MQSILVTISKHQTFPHIDQIQKYQKFRTFFFNLTPIGSFQPNTTQPHFSKTAPISKANTFPQQKRRKMHILLIRSGTAATRPSVKTVGNVSNFEV